MEEETKVYSFKLCGDRTRIISKRFKQKTPESFNESNPAPENALVTYIIDDGDDSYFSSRGAPISFNVVLTVLKSGIIKQWRNHSSGMLYRVFWKTSKNSCAFKKISICVCGLCIRPSTNKTIHCSIDQGEIQTACFAHALLLLTVEQIRNEIIKETFACLRNIEVAPPFPQVHEILDSVRLRLAEDKGVDDSSHHIRAESYTIQVTGWSGLVSFSSLWAVNA